LANQSLQNRKGLAGGLKGGESRAAKLTSIRRSEIARNAAKARWNRHPFGCGGIGESPLRIDVMSWGGENVRDIRFNSSSMLNDASPMAIAFTANATEFRISENSEFELLLNGKRLRLHTKKSEDVSATDDWNGPNSNPASPMALKMRISRLLRGDVRGQGLVEYLLALSLIALATVAAEQTFACRVGCAFESMTTELEHILGTGKKIPPGQAKKCSKKCD
jgi:Flp pilus assembly pilin Flp